ncbi:S-adenosyl-L-methionine-dependent methyltransferase [Crucibulum laeve]|uniref:Cytosine-specific methyltransferase n=1 Tax=Crucibulum laeve TaxID=68775 RepID=A0A5C3MDK3_9AGAR|nr:S-adenosyl-L-methionine-dependent methyltransferase [Crucibulum laeve]
MKGPPPGKLFPVVEILVKPPKRTLGSSKESPVSSPSPHKRRRRANQDCDFNDLFISPTISDFEMANPTSVSSVINLTALFDDKEEVSSRTGTTVPEVFVYEFMEDGLSEDEELFIDSNESQEDQCNSDSDDAETDASEDIPIYVLSDFIIYNHGTREVVPTAELMSSHLFQSHYAASGCVSPWVDDKHAKNYSKPGSFHLGRRVRLSKIRELNVHHFDKWNKDLDGKIYIRTDFAWYILEQPSPRYLEFFQLFWIQHKLLHMIVAAAVSDRKIMLDQFIKLLPVFDEDGFITTSKMILGRGLQESDLDLDSTNAYIVTFLLELASPMQITRVPLVRSFLDRNTIPTLPRNFNSVSPAKNNKQSQKSARDKQVTVTPIVARIASTLFEGLEVVGSSEFEEVECNVAAEIERVQEHHQDPQNIVWGIQAGVIGPKTFYESVTMDGTKYGSSDVVMVNPGEDDNTMRAKNSQADASKSVNSFANHTWICYFYECEGEKMFHGQWFIHGSKTLLQEVSHSKALYLTNECEDVPVASIFRLCNLRMLADGEAEPFDDRDPQSNDFHCGYEISLLMCENEVDFIHLPNQDELDALNEIEALREEVQTISGGFTQYGINYHVNDFVYIHPEEGSLLKIGQITKIRGIPDKPKITVHRLGRYDDYVRRKRRKSSGQELTCDERRLYVSKDNDNVITITPEELDGVCFVRHLTDFNEIESWVKNEDHFYLNQVGTIKQLCTIEEDEFPICEVCDKEHARKIEHQEMLRLRNAPLRGLELFCGAGGLGTGMGLSGFVETKYAVEMDAYAAATYKDNHPDTTVYCQDTCTLLKHAIDVYEGKNPPPLLSSDGKTYCPPVPGKHEVDFIFGGPPCQSFSQANHRPKANDPRSALPSNMLSFAEVFQPSTFLLENVIGILNFPLLSQQSEHGYGLEGGIKSGVVKFIVRTLIALGYQVRYLLLQAGQYGTPQGRSRVIFLATLRGIPLPRHPPPIYAFQAAKSYSLPTGQKLQRITRSKNPDYPHGFAPLKPITVDESIGDLPPFDWVNPHAIFPATEESKAEVVEREALGIRQFHAAGAARTERTGFTRGEPYAMPPQNRYQRWLRQGMIDDDGEEGKVRGHYTKKFVSHIVEATVNVPLEPLADHRDLHWKLRPKSVQSGRAQDGRTFYGRLDGNSHFKCAMAQASPNLKQSWLLHPSQKRIISIREFARAQGFPDHYSFETEEQGNTTPVTSQIKQIGNAVPVPLALALGKELGKSLLEIWDRKEREGSPIV